MPDRETLFEALAHHAERIADTHLLDLFEENPNRVSDLSFDLGSFQLDLSKTHLCGPLLDIYTTIAEQIGFVTKRDDFFRGAKINSTESRAVLHPLLRQTSAQFHSELSVDLSEQALHARDSFERQLKQIRSRIEQGEQPITDLIHIGIGGSSLGTQLVYESLSGLVNPLRVHFVSNIDGHQLASVLAMCDAHSTLVFGISKTFTTAETLQNVRTVLEWLNQEGVESPQSKLYAVTASPASALEFGVFEDQVIEFPNWVGGRYSVWSSVSISAALCMPENAFEEFLEGAAQMDKHFCDAPLPNNAPFLSACLDHFYTNYLGSQSRAIFAYDHRLRSLVPYLQQLETESNGKDRQITGEPVDQKTSAVIWGGVGTDVQHSVFQMMHQGTSLIPAEFILVAKADHQFAKHHSTLLANGVAQSAALLVGQDIADVLKNEPNLAGNELVQKSKVFSGNKPSTTFLLERLTPKALGALLAFYEHRTFCFGVLVNVNSFDQMGVELGKRLANDVSTHMPKPQSGFDSLDPSTQTLINKLNKVSNQ